MNMVLGDAEEFRKIKSKKGSGLTEEKLEKRMLGLIVLRGDSVVSLTIEGPPPPELDDKGKYTHLSMIVVPLTLLVQPLLAGLALGRL
jgi:hypothetical protein